MIIIAEESTLWTIYFCCISQDNFGYDLPAVEAAMKKHEAIEADISSYEERIGVVVELSAEMESEGYYDIRRILARKENILGQWKLLKELVAGRRTRLEKNLALQKIFQDMVYMIDWMEDTQVLEGPPLCVVVTFQLKYGLYNYKKTWVVLNPINLNNLDIIHPSTLLVSHSFHFLLLVRSNCCQKIMGSIFWRWKICCRSTAFRKQTLQCKQKGLNHSTKLHSNLPL